MPPNGKSAQRAHVQSLRDVARTFQPALNRLPSIEQVNKAQRAVGVLVKALDDLAEVLAK
jgi:hypothetical protein